MKRALAAGALAACSSAVGCGLTPSDARSRVERSPIVRGEPSELGGPEDAVLLLRTEVDGEEVLCSASLVADNLVLTSRHCVSHLVHGPFDCTVRGELVESPSGAGRLGLHLPAESLELYDGRTPRGDPVARGREVHSTLSPTICVNDLAFVVLDRSLELPILPLRLDGRAARGETGVLVGYGADETMGDFIDYRTQRRRRKGGLVIADVGPDLLEDGVTTVPPRTIVLEGPSGCIADSGGPLIAEETGALVGVYSLLVGRSCLDPDVRHEVTHVPPFRSLIDEAFAAAGAEPFPEAGVWDVDAGTEPVPVPSEEPCIGGECGRIGREGGVVHEGGVGREAGRDSARLEAGSEPTTDERHSGGGCTLRGLSDASAACGSILCGLLVLAIGSIGRRIR